MGPVLFTLIAVAVYYKENIYKFLGIDEESKEITRQE